MQTNKYFYYRDFPQSFNIVGLRARYRLREIENKKLPSNRNTIPLGLFKTFNRQKSLPEIIHKEISIAPNVISSEKKITDFIRKKFTIKTKKTSEQVSPRKNRSILKSNTTRPPSGTNNVLYKSTKVFRSSQSIKSYRNKSTMSSTMTQMLKRVESQPNIVYKPLFKLTSHAIINMNAYQFNKNQDNEEVSVNDGFDFDTVRLCCYDVVKAK